MIQSTLIRHHLYQKCALDSHILRATTDMVLRDLEIKEIRQNQMRLLNLKKKGEDYEYRSEN